MSRKMRWSIPVCRTCHRLAQWPFCEHRQDGSEWFAYVVATGTPPDHLDHGRAGDAGEGS